MARPAGPSSAPPPPRRPKLGEDALATILRGNDAQTVQADGDAITTTIRKELEVSHKSIDSLVASTKSDFLTVAGALRHMEACGEVVVAGDPGAEVARLVDESASRAGDHDD